MIGKEIQVAILKNSFDPKKLYTGGIITFIKHSCAQISHKDINYQMYAPATNFLPRRPNLVAMMKNETKLSFMVMVNATGAGLVAYFIHETFDI